MATMPLIACWHAETNLADAGRMGDQVRRILGKEGSQTCIYRSIGRQRMAMATPQPISCKGRGTWPDWSRRQPSTQDDYRFQNHLDTVKQPYVSHETGQWCAFPNFNEIRKYTGVNKAKNFEIFKDILADNHMSDQAHLFMMPAESCKPFVTNMK